MYKVWVTGHPGEGNQNSNNELGRVTLAVFREKILWLSTDSIHPTIRRTMSHLARPAAYTGLSAVSMLLAVFSVFTNYQLVSGQTCRTLTTFNAGLTPRINNYGDRVRMVPPALLEEDSDVICLQEYWFERDMEYLLEKVASKYPYHYSELHESIGTLTSSRRKRIFPKTPCNAADVMFFWLRVIPCSTISGCLPAFFTSLPDGLTCAAAKCAPVFKAFDEDCLSCITLSATSIATMLDACKPEGFTYNNRLNGAGLMLLSKHEIMNASFTEYFPGKELTIQRSFIEAEIKDLGTVTCSHFSAAFPYYFEYDLDFDNYAQQQRAEMSVIHNRYASRDHIMLADFNTGPQVETAATADRILTGEAPGNYQQWLDNGYNTTYMSDDGRCTFCNENPLVDVSNNAIDYVMFKGSSYTASPSQRTLDKSPPLSDHYGVRRTICVN
ncbi:hypothetical protein PoB_005849400 [Plakobranchus ocellatus]|uniref:Endonuclease/exonuclease/phosphatase domain-containing protein n=1 Tax=Plakobranchus ocellatus TaxID=259542 RepID=A0AAV4CL54_9GAST|nr:hypothetical protein PoB_005849400 [Plakobranchus ocellatus]